MLAHCEEFVRRSDMPYRVVERCVGDLFFSAFFFFQAEDGIRDDLVTGVQTCALPISAHHTTRQTASARLIHPGISSVVLGWPCVPCAPASNVRLGRDVGGACSTVPDRGSAPNLTRGRSEERRVGKECRCRGWRCDEKK